MQSQLILTYNLVFVPVEVIGIIRRKALIKELAAAYHAECLTYCQELLELQRKTDEASNFMLLKVSYVHLFDLPRLFTCY